MCRSRLPLRMWPAAALVLAGSAGLAYSQPSFPIGGQAYSPKGPTETLAVSFMAADGAVSAGSYSGFVKLVVSGSGVSCTPATNDAFWIHVWLPGCGNPNVVPSHDSANYQLTFDSKTLVSPVSTRIAAKFIYYDIDAGVEVTSRPYWPAYRTGHTYSVIVDTGLVTPGPLHFGVSDGYFLDNSGGYQVTITQLVAGEPTLFDLDGEGTSDILWRHAANGDMWLWAMANGTKAGDTYVGLVLDTDWEIRGQGDLDGDWTTDLLWRHKTDGTIYYWRMSAGASEEQSYVSTVDVSYDIAGTGDFDGDGASDILWRNPARGDVWLWRMNGANVLGQSYIDTVDLGYTIKGLGDINGDGRTDIVWSGTAGDVWVWLMNGAVRDAQAYLKTVADTTYQIQQVADFDGLGTADLLWRNTVSGEVWLWSMNGAAVQSEGYVGTVPDPNYRIVGTGDYDENGSADILWHHATAGDVWLWLMNGPVKVSERYVGTAADTGYRIVTAR